MPKTMRFVACAPALACALAAVSMADVIPVSRHSVVSSRTTRPGFPDQNQSESLDTFEPFSRSFSSVSQTSSITPSTATVFMSATGGVFMPGNIGVTTYTEFTYVFDLPVDGSFTLTGNWNAAAPLMLRLTGPSGTFAPAMGDFNLSGPLAAGRYTFQASIGEVMLNGGSLDATLTVVPTPGSAVVFGVAASFLRRRR